MCCHRPIGHQETPAARLASEMLAQGVRAHFQLCHVQHVHAPKAQLIILLLEEQSLTMPLYAPIKHRCAEPL